MDSIDNTLLNCVRTVMNDESLDVSMSQLLVDDVGMESIDVIDLISEIENEIGVEIDFNAMIENLSASSGATFTNDKLTLSHFKTYVEGIKG